MPITQVVQQNLYKCDWTFNDNCITNLLTKYRRKTIFKICQRWLSKQEHSDTFSNQCTNCPVFTPPCMIYKSRQKILTQAPRRSGSHPRHVLFDSIVNNLPFLDRNIVQPTPACGNTQQIQFHC